MAKITHPKWSYSTKSKTIVRYGSKLTYPDLESSSQKIASFKVFFEDFLSKYGLTELDCEESMRNTGGHMDIDYYALVMVNRGGGCECVFYTINWSKEYEAMIPWVQLYGSWRKLEPMLQEELNNRFS